MTDPSQEIVPNEERRRQPGRSEQFWEVLVFLFLIVPSMLLSLFIVRRANSSFILLASSAILRDLALVSLIFFFAWRNGEPLARLGWTPGEGWREAVLGLVLFAPFFLGAASLGAILRAAGLSSPSKPVQSLLGIRGGKELLLALLLVVVVAVAEETIFRGYLILRFQAVTGSAAAAVILSTAIFAIGHAYEGSAGVVAVGAMGLIFALVYLWRGSLTAPMVMHFLQDFIGIVLLPWIGMR